MKGKKHRKRRILPIVLGTAGGLILAAVIVVFGFRVRSFEVEGNVYYGENSIITWIQNDDLAVNSLYILAKYNVYESGSAVRGGQDGNIPEKSLDSACAGQRKKYDRLCGL